MKYVKSFGFRGEALNSLCNISEKLIIITKQKNDKSATRIVYDQHGDIISKNISQGTNGTTVIVEKIFFHLPVRRKELKRTLRREYTNMIKIIQEYAMICPEVKFNVLNQDKRG